MYLQEFAIPLTAPLLICWNISQGNKDNRFLENTFISALEQYLFILSNYYLFSAAHLVNINALPAEIDSLLQKTGLNTLLKCSIFNIKVYYI